MNTTDMQQFLASLNYAQLQYLKQDISTGSNQLKTHIESKIEEIELQNRSVCATCGNALLHVSTSPYTLLFGPTDFRKKASFCGIDCMHRFVHKLELLYEPEGERIVVNK